MKPTIFFVLVLFSLSVAHGQKYVPFPTENAEWNVLLSRSIDYSFSKPYITSIINYFIQGDTVINNKTYHKLYNKSDTSNKTFKGGLREEEKRIYYLSCGTGGYSLQVKSMSNEIKNCIKRQINYSENEILLYDFNKNRVGDSLFANCPIIDIDSVWIHNTYRKRYKIPNDYVIEGIGSVKQGLFGYITPLPICSYFAWEFLCFSQNGESVYKNPAYMNCNSNGLEDTNSYFGRNSCWSYKALVYAPLWNGDYLPMTISSSESLAGDTIINSLNYKKFIGNEGIAAIRQEGQKVYAKTPDQDNEFLLYDFSAAAGDVIISDSRHGYLSQKPTVSAVDSVIMYNGEKRKRIRVLGDTWIEGIGSVNGFMYSCREFVTCGCNSSYSLISFAKENHIKFYDSALAANYSICGGIIDDVEKISTNKISVIISPNPATDFMKLEFRDQNNRCLSVDMMDFQGRKINSKSFSGNKEMTIDLWGYKAGIYFVLVRFENATEVHKIIKM